MFQPEFKLTLKMLTQIGMIERLYGQLHSEKVIPSLSLRLFQENQILATHYSTSIEGNPLSPLDVTNIVLGDHIPITKSEKEVKNYFAALNHVAVLAKKKNAITISLTKELHHTLMSGLLEKNLGD